MTINEQNTEKEEVQGGAVESEQEEQVNILRDKTFNKELRELVNRIEKNEDGESVIPESDIFVPEEFTISDNTTQVKKEQQLLVDLHQLFYKIKQLEFLEEINTSFNPFKDETSAWKYNKQAIILNSMKQAGIDSYALLAYDFPSRAYLPYLYILEMLEKEQLVIGILDSLFEAVLNSENGYIVKAQQIDADPFLRKLFVFKNNPCDLYFITLNQLNHQLHGELALAKEPVIKNRLPSMILMVVLDGASSQLSERDVFIRIKEQATIPLFLANVNMLSSFKPQGSNDLAEKINLLEYLVALTAKRIGGLLYEISIRVDTGANINKLYIMKFVVSQIESVLTNNSAVVYLQNNRFLVFSDESESGEINRVISETKKYFEHDFRINTFNREACGRPDAVIDKILYEE